MIGQTRRRRIRPWLLAVALVVGLGNGLFWAMFWLIKLGELHVVCTSCG